MGYQETYDLQLKMAEARRNEIIPDTILAVQHPLTVSFGSSRENNKFGDSLIEEVRQKYNLVSNEKVIEYLGNKGIDFVEVSRGGGATVLAPGQFVYYPVLNYVPLVGNVPNIDKYKGMIYQTMFESLKGLGVKGINIGTDSRVSTRRDRRDVWIQRNGRSLKMGSKGVKFSKGVVHQGFVLYVNEEGIENFGLVKPCGYNHSEVSVSSVEKEIGKSVNTSEVNYRVRKALVNNFSYNFIKDVRKEDLFEQIGGING